MEKGAYILETIHGSQAYQTKMSNYYGLVASLAYYVSFQYSKSFILINKFESTTNIARLIRLFLLRDFTRLHDSIYRLIVNPEYSEAAVLEMDEKEGQQIIYEITIAKALDGFVKFLQTGSRSFLESARHLLRTLKEISAIEQDPGIWWVIRLLLLITDGVEDASLWKVLDDYFDIEDEQVKQYINALVYSQPIGIYELFITQRRSLKSVLNEDNKGSVVSIPTSSGKTKIAEIAILHSVKKDPECKVLYIAPFRSLAFEIENSLERVFEGTGITISHFYRGSMYGKLNELAIDESTVLIATPEKAKAILRGNKEVISQIKLAIISSFVEKLSCFNPSLSKLTFHNQ